LVQNGATEVIESLLSERLAQITASGDWNSLCEIADSEQENLIRDWLFVSRCLLQARSNLTVAIGLSDGGCWAWRKIPPGTELFDIWDSSRPYRSLLSDRHWQQLIKEREMPLPYLDLQFLASLGKIPERKVFAETGMILKQAITQKRYGIARGTTIIVGKKGFESISIDSLSPDSRHCIFKIVVKKDHKGHDFCLFGKIDAALGKINALGMKHTLESEKSVSLLLFLAAIAYRDCVVARDSLQPPDSKRAKKNNANNKNKVSRRHQPQPPLLARLKNSSDQIGDRFADPNEFLNKLKKQCPTFRVEHLRDLPDGHKASEKQIDLAKVYGIFVPEGFTFVSPSGSGDISQAQEHQYRSLSLLKLFFD
jgi:hypothetical protein